MKINIFEIGYPDSAGPVKDQIALFAAKEWKGKDWDFKVLNHEKGVAGGLTWCAVVRIDA